MIVPMKKVGVIAQSKDTPAVIEELRRLGVMHIEHQQPPAGGDINRLQDDLILARAALDVLARADTRKKAGAFEQKPLADWRLACRHLIDLEKRLEQLRDYGLNLQAQIYQWQPWGDFDPARIAQLARQGIFVRLFQIPVKRISELPPEAIVRRVGRAAGMELCAVISRARLTLPFNEIPLPKMGLSAMRRRIAQDEHIAQGIRKELIQHLCHLESLRQAGRQLGQQLQFQQALAGAGRQAALSYIIGYAPFDAQQLLMQAAQQQRWAISVDDPSEEDAVPTLVRNPRWVSFIEPVFKFIDIVPGYRELDISLVFLLFFSVFFGMLISDAGVGLVFILATALVQFKFGKAVRPKAVFALCYVLSLFAVAWGVLSGTFFGQEWLPARVRPLLPALREDASVQSLCFFIGALHLSIGHGWRALVKAPSVRALADVGWIALLWAAFFLAQNLVVGRPLAPAAKPLFIAGSLAIVLFTAPRRNLAAGLAQGAGHYLLNVVNSFTDVVSYIRLFAVGLASVAIADAFNAMAAGVGMNNAFAAILTGLILLVGHGLNLLLGPMSVLVHGVRLNVLEFCNHIDIKWNGFAYSPLRN